MNKRMNKIAEILQDHQIWKKAQEIMEESPENEAAGEQVAEQIFQQFLQEIESNLFD